MVEEIHFSQSESKENRYKELLPQIKAVLSGESDLIANQANLCAILKEAFDFLWVGFYRVSSDELILGPFQGPLACTRISRGKGVCVSAWEEAITLIVEDFDQFPGHIACSSKSRSEIVVPFFDARGVVIAVLDIDSVNLAAFDSTDRHYLEEIRSYF